MADTVRRTSIVVGVTDKATAPTKAITGALGGLGAAATTATGSVNLLNAAIVGVAALGVGGIFKDAIGTTIQFNKAVSNLSAITGAVGKDLDAFSKRAREIGKSTTLSATQAVTAFKLVGSLRPELLQSADALSEVTSQSVTLAEAAGITLPEAAKATVVALNQFGAASEEAGRFVNALAAASKFGSAEVEPLTQVLTRAGTVAAAAGVEFETFLAVVGRLSKFGQPLETIGVGIRNILLVLQEGADETNPKVVGLTAAIQNLGKQTLTTAELTKLFGRENVTTAQNIISEIDAIAALEQQITGTNTAIEQQITNLDNLSGDIALAASAFKELQLQLVGGEKSLRAITQSVTAFIDSVAPIAGTAVQFIALVAGAKAASLAIGFLGTTTAATAIQMARFGLISRTTAARLVVVTTATKAAAGAMTLLRGGLAIIGGPAGLAFLAGAALFFMSEQETAAEKAAVAHKDAIDAVNEALGKEIPIMDSAAQSAKDLAEASLEATLAQIALLEALVASQEIDKGFGFSAETAGDREALEELEQRVSDITAAIVKLNELPPPAIAAPASTGATGGGGKPNKDATDLIATLNIQLEQQQRLLAAQRQGEQAINETTDAIKAENLARQAKIDLESEDFKKVKDLVEQTNELTRATEDLVDHQRQLQSVLDSIRGAADRYKEDTSALKELHAQGRITATEFANAQRDMRIDFLDTQTDAASGFERAFLKIGRDAEDMASTIEGAITDSFDAAGDAIEDFVKTGKLDFGSLLRDISGQLAKLSFKQLSGELSKALFPDSAGGGGGQGAPGIAGGQVFSGLTTSAQTASIGLAQAGVAANQNAQSTQALAQSTTAASNIMTGTFIGALSFAASGLAALFGGGGGLSKTGRLLSTIVGVAGALGGAAANAGLFSGSTGVSTTGAGAGSPFGSGVGSGQGGAPGFNVTRVPFPNRNTIPGLQHGGSFMIPGHGGPDTRVMRASNRNGPDVEVAVSPQETVTVTPPGGGGGGETERLLAQVATLLARIDANTRGVERALTEPAPTRRGFNVDRGSRAAELGILMDVQVARNR